MVRPRVSKFVTPDWVEDLVAASYSGTYNPRNIEVEHYSEHLDTQSLTVNKLKTVAGGTLAARQQHNLWLTSDDVKPEDLDDVAYHDGWSEEVEDASADGPRRSTRISKHKGASQQVASVNRHPTSSAAPGHADDQHDGDVLAGLDDGPGEVAQADEEPLEVGQQPDQRQEQVLEQVDGGDHHDAEGGTLDDDDVGNNSFMTNATQPNKGGKDSFPDIVVSHTVTIKTKAPSDNPDARDARISYQRRLAVPYETMNSRR
ncbi:hypothetical protein L226DRAFT_368426 [Lentinus tigrinus ALCF2SS1-7]|uniref:uncharacterized protein n=1 Tax=Lentinus tigrinus ALCF2SS1-7 TaxID=1328758 RepID=UPI001165CCC2|nr:hypothetical protein L226DRAFT_368426 [Lentinus tigrinus ALCF2SS1-7]